MKELKGENISRDPGKATEDTTWPHHKQTTIHKIVNLVIIT